MTPSGPDRSADESRKHTNALDGASGRARTDVEHNCWRDRRTLDALEPPAVGCRSRRHRCASPLGRPGRTRLTRGCHRSRSHSGQRHRRAARLRPRRHRRGRARAHRRLHGDDPHTPDRGARRSPGDHCRHRGCVAAESDRRMAGRHQPRHLHTQRVQGFAPSHRVRRRRRRVLELELHR